MNTPSNKSSSFACDLTAIPSEAHEDKERGTTVAKFIENECCAALHLMFHRSLDISLRAQ